MVLKNCSLGRARLVAPEFGFYVCVYECVRVPVYACVIKRERATAVASAERETVTSRRKREREQEEKTESAYTYIYIQIIKCVYILYISRADNTQFNMPYNTITDGIRALSSLKDVYI